MLSILSAIGAILKKILTKTPWWVWAALGVCVCVWYYGHWRYEAGRTKAEAACKAREAAAAEAAKAIEEKQAQETVRVETVYVDRVRTVYQRGKDIVKQVPVFVHDSDLSGGFRVFYDASVRGVVPDAASVADAAPVPATDVAATTADNFTVCRATAAQLSALQEWVQTQYEISKHGRPPSDT